MPTNVRYSASLDQTYEEREALRSPSLNSDGDATAPRSLAAEPPSGASYGSGGEYSFQQGRADSVDSLDSLGSGSGSGGGHSRQISSDGTEFIPTRSVKSNARLAFNPLQFVKTGTSQLVKKAEEQIRHYEEVKKAKEMVKEEEETWQLNLDSWKSRRRLRSLKSIDQADEMREAEMEEFEGRRKNKTFNEMMEERSKRGASMKIPSYDDKWNDHYHGGDDGDDEGDSAPPRTDYSFDSSGSDHVFGEEAGANGTDHEVSYGGASLSGSSSQGEHRELNGSRTAVESSSRVEEYTFEKAIRSYAEFAESRTKGGLGKKQLSLAGATGAQLVNKNLLDSNGENGGSVLEERQNCNFKDTSVDQKEDDSGVRVERAEGEQLTAIISLRRGVDSKDFGFTIKGVRGIGTGVFVDAIHPQSPAETAGLKPSDEILAINGEVCSMKRTHSAIVFAIKQAVYTGRLELDIYRYRDPDLVLHGRPLASSSPVQNVSQDLPVGNGLLESKAEVVRHRRSLFEMAASSSSASTPDRGTPEKWRNRRSLDVSEALKDRLAPFENSDGAEKPLMANRRSRTPERNSAFKEKLASFQSLDSLDTGRLTEQQFHWQNGGGPQNNSSGNRKAITPTAAATSWRSFERTRSCEELDVEKRLSSGGEWRHLVDGQEADRVTEKREVGLLVEPQAPSATASWQGNRTMDKHPGPSEHEHSWTESCQDDMIQSNCNDSVSSVVQPKLFEAPTMKQSNWSPAKDSRTSGIHQVKQGFELAKDLEETAIIGSVPNSPRELHSQPPPSDQCLTDSNNNTDHNRDVVTPNVTDWPEDHGEAYKARGGSAHVVNEPNPQPDPVDGIDSFLDQVESDASNDLVGCEPKIAREPPKEKPPPPPVEVPESPVTITATSESPDVPRREIRRELWKRRSDFLGIDPGDTQDYIDNEIRQLSTPPVIVDALREELSELKRHQILNLDKDRNLAKAMLDPSVLSEQDRSQAVAEYGLGGVQSERQDEEDIARKEREIIEYLELEESQWHHGRHSATTSPPPGVGASKFGRSSSNGEEAQAWSKTIQYQDNAGSRELAEAQRLKELEEALRRQEEALRMEKEKLRLEQEALLRQKEEYQREIQRHQGRYDEATDGCPWSPIYDEVRPISTRKTEDMARLGLPITPPVPPSKPKIVSPEPPDNGQHLRQYPDMESSPTITPVESPTGREEPMANSIPNQAQTKQALFALSAAPKAKLLDGDQWLTAHRKSESPRRDDYNRHWLVQEAEFRRLHPQNSGPTTPPRPEDRSPGRIQNGHPPQPTLNGDHRCSQESPPGAVRNGQIMPDSPGPRVQATLREPVTPERKLLDSDRQVGTPKVDGNLVSNASSLADREPGMLSVSGKKKCSHCSKELGRGAAMIIESLQLFYHIGCFKCCVCHVQLGNGTSGADVRVRSQKLHCHNCYSNDEGLKFSKV